jgi:predicted SAM-dependent methyltransferase
MYKYLKNILRKIFPKRFLFLYEPKIRFLLYQFYRGKAYQCNICNKNLRKFINLESDLLCPNCGSISRNRRLWYLLKANFLKKGMNILDFSPSRSIYRLMKKDNLLNYDSTDLSGDFIADYTHDITNISINDETYDLIICYHILEHIEDDIKAMKELYRILKKDGNCIIQTPFKEGDIYEDSSKLSKEDRLKSFGQEDHVRIYSVSGLKDRLKKCGFNVSVNEYKSNGNHKHGFSNFEYVLICNK